MAGESSKPAFCLAVCAVVDDERGRPEVAVVEDGLLWVRLSARDLVERLRGSDDLWLQIAVVCTVCGGSPEEGSSVCGGGPDSAGTLLVSADVDAGEQVEILRTGGWFSQGRERSDTLDD